MPQLFCSMPHCIHKDNNGECNAEVVELMFGIVMQLAGRGAEAFQRCAQIRTSLDVDEDQPSSGKEP